jgi:hypothetical protein
VAELYIKQKLARARQPERSAQEIRKELIPVWGARRINSFQRGDVIRLIDQLRDRMDRSAEASNELSQYSDAGLRRCECTTRRCLPAARY